MYDVTVGERANDVMLQWGIVELCTVYSGWRGRPLTSSSPTIEIKYQNVMTDWRHFFDQPIKMI